MKRSSLAAVLAALMSLTHSTNIMADDFETIVSTETFLESDTDSSDDLADAVIRSNERIAGKQVQQSRPDFSSLENITKPIPIYSTNEKDNSTNLDVSEVSSINTGLLNGRQAVFRLYNCHSGEHFYTTSLQERQSAIQQGWQDEGIGFYGMRDDHSNPVYRLYNPNVGDHHYTSSMVECQMLTERGWQNEKIAWYADPEGSTPIYRLYNPNATTGSHHYTISFAEYTELEKAGWQGEKIGFYGAPMYAYKICHEMRDGQEGEVWYDLNGKELSGSLRIDENWYYFHPITKIKAVNQFVQIPETNITRYFGPDGKAITGAASIDGKTYGFSKQDAAMICNQKYIFANGDFLDLDENGQARIGEFSQGGMRYQTDADGRIETVSPSIPLPLFMQNDSRWGMEVVGQYLFYGLGCLPTSMTTILNTFAHADLTPIQAGRMLEQAGYLNGDLNRNPPQPIGCLLDGIPWIAKRYQLECRTNLNMDQTVQVLKQGGLVELNMGRGIFTDGTYSHEILVYGYDHGKVYVHDPLTAGNSGNYPLQLLFDQRNLDPDGLMGGSPVHGFINPDASIFIESQF